VKNFEFAKEVKLEFGTTLSAIHGPVRKAWVYTSLQDLRSGHDFVLRCRATATFDFDSFHSDDTESQSTFDISPAVSDRTRRSYWRTAEGTSGQINC
jgi:hypothetical protein